MGRLYCDVVIVVQSNDELKKMLLEMQGQGNQGAAVAALEMEVLELLQKMEMLEQRAISSEGRLGATEQELSDYKELNDLLELDNARFARVFPPFPVPRLTISPVPTGAPTS